MTCSLEINIFQTEFFGCCKNQLLIFFSHLHVKEKKHFAEFDLSFERRKIVTEKTN